MQTARLLLTLLATALAASAQTTYFSSLSAPNTGTVYRDNTSTVGQRFTTDSSAPSFTLNSVSVYLTSAYGMDDFTVNIMTDSGANTPGTLVGSLSGPVSPSGSTTFDFTTSGFSLTAGTSYWVTMGFTSGSGMFGFAMTNDLSSATGNWTLGGYATTYAGYWNYAGSGTNSIISIAATPVPEPSTYAALAGLVALGVIIARRRRA